MQDAQAAWLPCSARVAGFHEKACSPQEKRAVTQAVVR